MKKDFVISAYIVHNNRLLLVHHKGLDMWLPVGGHIEPEETPEQAVKREALEEAGLEVEIIGENNSKIDDRVNILTTPHHIQLEEIDGKHQHIDLVYFCRAKTDKIKLAEREHHNIKWFSEKELESPEITNQIRYFGRTALRELKQ